MVLNAKFCDDIQMFFFSGISHLIYKFLKKILKSVKIDGLYHLVSKKFQNIIFFVK